MPHRQQLCLEWNQSLSPYLTTSILLRRVGHSYTPNALTLKFHQLKKKKKSVSTTTVIVRNLTERDKVSCYSLGFFYSFLFVFNLLAVYLNLFRFFSYAHKKQLLPIMRGKDRVAGCATNKVFSRRKWILLCTLQAAWSLHYLFPCTVCWEVERTLHPL